MANIIVDELVTTLTFDCSNAMRGIDALQQQLQRLAPHCCFIDCPAPAVVAIYDTRPETNWEERETHACADHVRDLGGEESYAIVEKFGQTPPIIDEVAHDAGRRAAARAWTVGEHDQATLESIELAERKAVKERLTTRFTETGELPRAVPPFVNIIGQRDICVGPMRDDAVARMTHEQLCSAVRRGLASEER